MEGLRDSSGLFGVARHPEAAHRALLGLHALQHRGGHAVGIAAADGQVVRCARAWGPGVEALSGTTLQALTGSMAIGQVHGATEAKDGLDGGDRLVAARHRAGQVAVALSGRLTNGNQLRHELKSHGALLQSAGDAEVVAHLVAHSGMGTDVNRLVDALWKVRGGWSALVCSADRLVAVRDPAGLRPLWMGQDDDTVWFASDEAAITFAGGTPSREVEPGEMVIVDPWGMHCVSPFERRAKSGCIQELVALTRGDGRVFGLEAWSVRVGIGERLAKEAPAPRAAVVVGLPGAGEAIASGFGRGARVPVERGVIEAPIGRGLPVEPASGLPDYAARTRWAVIPAVVAERSVCLVAPSSLPNESLGRLVRMIRAAGAREVHLRVASPPLRAACAYGVTMPTADELMPEGSGAGGRLGVDSFGHLSLEGLHAVVGKRVDETPIYCDACLSGRHPVPPEAEVGVDQLDLFR